MTRLKDLFLDISSSCSTSSTLLLFIANLGLYCDQRGKEVEVKIVQTTIQQISANPARPQSMQPNIYQVKIFEESWRFFGEVFDLVRASRCNQFAINKFVAREHLNEKLSHLSNRLF